MAPVMLVHGAWHGPWCWYKVIDGLGARGVTVVAPELPLLQGVGADAEVVATALAGIDEPVVLLGHSYGGQVISLAGRDRDQVRHLVYLCAMQMDETDSWPELLGFGPNVGAAMRTEGDHRVVIPEAAAATFVSSP